MPQVYLCHGSDKYRSKEWLKQLEKSCLLGLPPDLCLSVYDGKGLEVSAVLAALQTCSLLGDTRFVVVHNTDKMNEKDQSTLAESIVKGLPESATLVLNFDEVDKRRKLYQTVAKVGQVTEFKPLVGTELRSWLRGKLREFGLSISREAGEYILQRDGNSLEDITHDLEKLSIRWAGETRMLGLADVVELVGGVAEENVFKLLDAIGERNSKAAVAELVKSLAAGLEPTQIIGMTARQVRTILYCTASASVGKNAGLSIDELAQLAQVHRYTASLCLRHAQRFKTSELIEALHRLSELDIRIKSSDIDGKKALEVLIAEMAG